MLTQKQRQVAQDLFGSAFSEDEIIARHQITSGVYRRWLDSPVFQQELKHLMFYAQQRAEFNLASSAPLAAFKLAQLLGEDNLEVSRKAAVDIIDRFLKLAARTPVRNATKENQPSPEDLSDEEAVNTLLTLAKEMK